VFPKIIGTNQDNHGARMQIQYVRLKTIEEIRRRIAANSTIHDLEVQVSKVLRKGVPAVDYGVAYENDPIPILSSVLGKECPTLQVLGSKAGPR
jgi:hypothetical protein